MLAAKRRVGNRYRRVELGYVVLPPAVTDTNLLLQISAAIARDEEHGTFDAIRRRCFITRSVDEETTERSRSRARSRFKLDPDAMHRAWMHDIRPHLRIVDIVGDDLEHDAIDQVRSRNADQADIDTAALAVLLSPCMVITGDDDLRAVARPHLPPDVRRDIRHAEPSHHQVARNRTPLVTRHTLLQGATVGGLVTFDMARELVTVLQRTTLGRIALAAGAGATIVATNNPAVRATVATVARGMADVSGTVALEAITAEQVCATRMFPEAEPQSLAHRIAQHVVHYPLWLAPEGIASSLQLHDDDVRQACRHKWFSVGVFGSVKVGMSYDVPDEIEGVVVDPG